MLSSHPAFCRQLRERERERDENRRSVSVPAYFTVKLTDQNSFTLIELLIVIAVIGILAAAVVLVMNPGQLLAQARDGTRIQDIATINSALGDYLADGNTSLGTANTVYVSLPDPTLTGNQTSTCSSLGLPSLPSGWNYQCVSSANLRKNNGTGWIPVNFASITSGSPLPTVPIDPVNTTTTGNYYEYVTNGTNYEVMAVAMESAKYMDVGGQAGGDSATSYSLGTNLALAPLTFPMNWIQVPGNSTFGTPAFWVMKYDAKCVSGSTPLISPQDTNYHVYDNATQPCVAPYYVASAPNGYPIADIDHTDASTYCSNIGAHLIRNDEWMTIADNVAGVSSNWSGGSVGNGYLYSGHNDNAPANALQASANDNNGYYHETNTGGNQRRTLTLSNNNVIWDLAGNVWEHVARSTNDSGDNINTMSVPSCSNASASWEWCQYGNSTTPYVSAYTSDVVQSLVAPPNSSWNSNQGVGQVYTYGTGGNQGTSVFIRGAPWGNGSHVGAFALYLNWGTGSAYGDVGFRCAR